MPSLKVLWGNNWGGGAQAVKYCTHVSKKAVCFGCRGTVVRVCHACAACSVLISMFSTCVLANSWLLCCGQVMLRVAGDLESHIRFYNEVGHGLLTQLLLAPAACHDL